MPPAAISRLFGGFFGVFIDWPLIQSFCLENLLILRSKAVGICAETIEKVKTEEEIKEVINEDLDSNIDKEKTKCTDSAINKEVSEFQDTVGILDKNSVSISEVEKVRN